MPTPNQERRLVSEFSVELFRRGFVANHDGNVSARIGREGRFLITPTGVSKRLCTPESLVECDRAGQEADRSGPEAECKCADAPPARRVAIDEDGRGGFVQRRSPRRPIRVS